MTAQTRQLKQQLRSALVAGQWRGDTALTLPLFWRWSTVSPVFFGRYPRSSLHSFVPFPLSPSLISHLASVDVKQNGPGSFHSSGAVWEWRWPSWAVRPNEPSGFRGRKDLLNHASALVSACPYIRGVFCLFVFCFSYRRESVCVRSLVRVCVCVTDASSATIFEACYLPDQ